MVPLHASHDATLAPNVDELGQAESAVAVAMKAPVLSLGQCSAAPKVDRISHALH